MLWCKQHTVYNLWHLVLGQGDYIIYHSNQDILKVKKCYE